MRWWAWARAGAQIEGGIAPQPSVLPAPTSSALPETLVPQTQPRGALRTTTV